MRRYLISLILLVFLSYMFYLALDLPERKLKKQDALFLSQTRQLAGNTPLPKNFVPLTTYYQVKRQDNGRAAVCFTPLSKYFKAGAEYRLSESKDEIKYVGVGAGDNCVQCVEK